MVGQHFDGVGKTCQRLDGWIPWLGIDFGEIVARDGCRIVLEPACGLDNLIGVCARRQYQRQQRIRVERDGSQEIFKIRHRIDVGGLVGWRGRRRRAPVAPDPVPGAFARRDVSAVVVHPNIAMTASRIQYSVENLTFVCKDPAMQLSCCLQSSLVGRSQTSGPTGIAGLKQVCPARCPYIGTPILDRGRPRFRVRRQSWCDARARI